MTTISEDIKKLLGGSNEDKLEVIERRTKERLRVILGVREIPDQFEHISYEVTLKRFNRIGNEGMASYSQEGLSMTFPESDFSEYQDEIDDWLNAQEDDGELKRGRFRLY